MHAVILVTRGSSLRRPYFLFILAGKPMLGLVWDTVFTTQTLILSCVTYLGVNRFFLGRIVCIDCIDT